MKTKECLLYTTGLDSYIARYYLLDKGHKFDCIYFDHGGRYCKNEKKRILNLDFPVNIYDTLDFKWIEQPDAFIKNRNILMTIMANSLGYDKIWLGGSLSDRIGDNKSDVYQRLSELLSTVNDSYMRIDSPFYDVYKDDMINWFRKNHYDELLSLATKTFSCFNPVRPRKIIAQHGSISDFSYVTDECLNCSACFRKAAVLSGCGLYIPFKNTKIMNKYKKEFSKLNLRETPRSYTTLRYIEHNEI